MDGNRNMNGFNQLFSFAFGVITWWVLTGSVASSQNLIPVFPASGDMITFSDLVTRGFEWTAEPAVDNFQVRIFGPDAFLSQVPFPSTSSPLKLQQYLKMYFPEGSQFEWQLERVDTNGTILETSIQVAFTIVSQLNLIPSPTPLVWPAPSGDLDGSARIDARDLFILASSWITSDGSLRSGVLNQDSVINRDDLILYQERFGKPGDPAPVSAPIGIPRNLQFSPYSQVTIAETPTLVISWSVPSYPQKSGIVYDMLIIPPYGTNIEVQGIASTSYQPFDGMMTRTGIYQVYLQARLDGVGVSDIATGQFEIVYARSATPTPTPVPQTSDISGDSSTDLLDIYNLLDTFYTYKGHVNFNSLADLFTDNQIDRMDLLRFYQYYTNRLRILAAPQWTIAEVPIVEKVQLNPPENYQNVDLVSPYQITLGMSGTNNPLAELYYMRIHFSSVEGAADYSVKYYAEDAPQTSFVVRTAGKTYLENIILLRIGITILVEVQAIGEGQLVGEKSEILRVIIPAN